MVTTDDYNAFKKILTTDPGTLPKGTRRQQSWLQSVGLGTSLLEGDQLITCPNCRGSGIREIHTELVALIPYNDERLKPRWTKVKILLALLICGIIIGALTYIFFPGHVAVTSTNAEIVNATIVEIDWINPANNSGKSQIFWKVDITVENQNRVLTINIDKLDVYLRIDAWDRSMVGNETYSNFTVGANSKLSRSYYLQTPDHHKGPKGTANYSDAVLNCRCCNQYHTWGDLFVLTSATLRYTLKIAGFDYFSSFISSEEKAYSSNCNYFDNIGKLNISCESFNTCFVHGDLDYM